MQGTLHTERETYRCGGPDASEAAAALVATMITTIRRSLGTDSKGGISVSCVFSEPANAGFGDC